MPCRLEVLKKLGDVITFELTLSKPGRSNNGLYATNITVHNIRTGQSHTDNISKIANYISKLEFNETVVMT
jgi:hypothetical protein